MMRPLLALTALLAACSSTPPRFHTLVAPAPAERAPAPGYAFAVLPVSVPPQVNVAPLVVRQGASELVINDGEQWASALSDEIRAALSAELGARLGAADLTRLRGAAGQSVYRIRLDVRRFDSILGQSALLEAGWALLPPGKDEPAVVCSSRADVRVEGGYPALVRGHQQALARLSAEIAAALGMLAQGRAASCPGS